MRRSVRGLIAFAAALALQAAASRPALAWGDEGHEVIALIAERYLDPAVRNRVSALLAADADPLTTHDIAAAATWADKLRDVNGNDMRQRTRQWHYVDIEISAPDLDRACFGHRRLPAGVAASNGSAQACIVDKIDEFAAELTNPETDPEERIVALKFLLHLVGDVHQPLHAADDRDRGGNDKRVSAAGFPAGNLHHFWDTVFVEQLGPDAGRIASALIGQITQDEVRDWSQGEASDWAMETFGLAKGDAYGRLPEPGSRGNLRLTDSYFAMATRDVAMQLCKAGVRLAFVLNTVQSRASAVNHASAPQIGGGLPNR